jgi:type I restriction enzyme S subunit
MTDDRKLPEGWRWVRFGDVVREVRAATKNPMAGGLSRVVGLEHLDSESLPLRRWNELSDLADGTSFTRIFRAGQLLFGKRRAYQRKVAVPDFDGLCSSDILVFEPSTNELLPEFLPYLVQSDGFFDHALGTSAGSLSPRTKFQDLARYEFALPSLLAQAEIAQILGSAWEAADTYLRAGHHAGLTLEAVRRELIDQDRACNVARLGEIADLGMGRVYPSADYGEQGLRLLRPGNISPSGYLDWAPRNTVCLPSHYGDERGAVMLAAGDIVMNLTAQSMEDGFLGRVCLARDGDESIVNQRIARLRGTDLPTEYLFRVLQDQSFRNHVERIAKGSKIKHLYWQDLSQFEVPWPSAFRAAEVVARLDAAEQVLITAATAARDVKRTMSALAETLLKGAV